MAEHYALTLPGIRSAAAKYVAGMLCVVLSAFLYLVPNALSASRGAVLTLTAIDRDIPFWPGTGWIYASVYVFLLWTFVRMRDPDRVSRFLYACAFAQIAAAAVFVLYPVVYPRELFPVPSGTHAWNEALVAFWRGIDGPANCLPSLHVSTSLLCAVAFERTRRADTMIIVAFAVLFSLSTLTFKQHYAVDVVTGFALGLLSYWLFFRWSRIQVSCGVRAR